MSSDSPNLIEILVQKMSYLNQKQAVLAENVANANTPGYKQLDVKPFSFGEALRQAYVGLTVTDPRHIVPGKMAGVNARTYKTTGGEILPSGNNVDLEGQMIEVSKTASDYQATASLYHKVTGLFKIALKGSST